MKDRNIQIENEFLDDHFEKNQSMEVNLPIFKQKTIQFIYTSFYNQFGITNVNPVAATSCQLLSEQINGGDFLLFTDGKQGIYFERPKFSGNVCAINSKRYYNRENLKLITAVNSGKFINLMDYKR